MVKPSHFGGYSDAYTVDCERVLVTLNPATARSQTP